MLPRPRRYTDSRRSLKGDRNSIDQSEHGDLQRDIREWTEDNKTVGTYMDILTGGYEAILAGHGTDSKHGRERSHVVNGR